MAYVTLQDSGANGTASSDAPFGHDFPASQAYPYSYPYAYPYH